MPFTLIVHAQVKPEHIEFAKGKLVEAAEIYRKDAGTIDWHVMQDVNDPTKFSIVERYEKASDVETHRANPHYAKFGEMIGPVVQKPLEILTYNEL